MKYSLLRALAILNIKNDKPGRPVFREDSSH